MTLASLGICTGSIYSAFLIWGLLQERLTTTPYSGSGIDAVSSPPEFFKSPLFINAVQAALCSVLAGIYLLLRRPSGDKRALGTVLGLQLLTPAGAEAARKQKGGKHNGAAVVAGTDEKKALAAATNGSREKPPSSFALSTISPVLVRYLLIATLQSTGSQLGFLSLRHISYPTMILGKSCKLVPVLLMNLLLYRRKIAGYKYAVVALVTLGISIFMLFGHEGGTSDAAAAADAVKKAVKKKKKHAPPASSSLFGLLLLTGNLLADGATNSTQDEIFAHYALSGPQMMLAMNAFSAMLLTASLLVPDPSALLGSIPVLASVLGASSKRAGASNELGTALAFIHRHPEVLRDILAYALAGALGQIAIFETLERFGSLTLVSITVTRKLFTMLLSVAVYKHALSPLQWIGVLVVFAGIGIEAREKRREGLAKRVLNGSAKAKVKDA
ncbi:UDP-galactose transporter [Tilletia horrida]|uniref:UDP-galactose transporter homolog 1 n=1 Tax=Tilletia horrida TaxID=155126 RepID=A0AAN6GIC3_9BASI|nr:UDP-galactose transporter [Tilletia horrida]KAK0541333.1 UDP-galactose transporter [Tilletia horrida]